MVGSKADVAARISPWLKLGHALAKFVVFFALGLLVLVFAPSRLDGVAGAIGRQPLKVLLAGLLGTLAMPVLAVPPDRHHRGDPARRRAGRRNAPRRRGRLQRRSRCSSAGRSRSRRGGPHRSCNSPSAPPALVAIGENPGGGSLRHGLGVAHRLRSRGADALRPPRRPGRRCRRARRASAAGGVIGGGYRPFPGRARAGAPAPPPRTRRTSA